MSYSSLCELTDEDQKNIDELDVSAREEWDYDDYSVQFFCDRCGEYLSNEIPKCAHDFHDCFLTLCKRVRELEARLERHNL